MFSYFRSSYTFFTFLRIGNPLSHWILVFSFPVNSFISIMVGYMFRIRMHSYVWIFVGWSKIDNGVMQEGNLLFYGKTPQYVLFRRIVSSYVLLRYIIGLMMFRRVVVIDKTSSNVIIKLTVYFWHPINSQLK